MGLNDIKKAIKETPIENILEKRIELTSYNNRLSAPCPFHNGTSLGTFFVGGSRNEYRCFQCAPKGTTDKGVGDAIRFYMEILNLGFKDAVLQIGLDMEWITDAEYKVLKGKNKGNSIPLDIKVTSKVVEKKPLRQPANPIILNSIYSIFCKGNSLIGQQKLSKVHFKYLKERGLSDAQIKNDGYFTFPKKEDIFEEFLKEVESNGINKFDLFNVPGFYANDYSKISNPEKSLTWNNLFGIGIPIKNAKGQIAGIQIRKNNIKKEDDTRYIWFSSGKYAYDAPQGAGKSAFGTVSGTPIGVFKPKKLRDNSTVLLTEGIFKASMLKRKYREISITMQGVGNYAGITNEISTLIEDGVSIERLVIAYDADMSSNPVVANHLIGLGDVLSKKFPKIPVFVLVWNHSFGKGIDDMLMAGYSEYIRTINFLEFKEVYEELLTDFIEEYGPKPQNKFAKEDWETSLDEIYLDTFKI